MSFEDSELRENPLSRRTLALHPFVSDGYRRAIGELYYHLEFGPRILGVMSAPGGGRTTLLRQVERRIRAGSPTMFLSAECCHLEAGLRALGSNGNGVDQRHADRSSAPGGDQSARLVVFVDDAHNLDDSALLALRSLVRAAALEKNCATIVLGGPPEIADRLIGRDLRENFHGVSIAPLTGEEVARYIAHQLRLAAWQDAIFSPDACAAVAEISQGACGKINDLCAEALRKAAQRGSSSIDASFFPRRASRSGAAAVPTPLADRRRRGSRLTLAVPAYAIAALVVVGLWYGLDRRADPIAALQPSRSPSDVRIDDLSVPKSLSKPPASDAPKAAVATNPMHSADRPSAPPLRPGATASSRVLPAPVPSAAPRSLAPPPAHAGIVKQASPTRRAEPHAMAKAVAPAQRMVASKVSAPVARPSDARAEKASPPSTARHSRATRAAVESGPTALALEQASFETRLGDAYMRLGEYDNAIRSFRIALGLTPRNQEIEQKIERALSARSTEESVLR